MRRHTATSALLAALALSGCDLLATLGVESPAVIAERREAEGKAIGGACRHAGRAIEDCYALNKKAEKAAVFAGWREMNDYMRENNIEAVPPQASATAHDEEADEPLAKPGKVASKSAKGDKGAAATLRADKSDKSGGPSAGPGAKHDS